ncbi:MAG: hypothetical protein IAF02_20370 [Anaerolineae bacterium]|nr:hypothetical protein [Anaerolineae bacterium]
MMNEKVVCLNCNRADTEVPLLAMQFLGKSNWICSQCLPTLIHKPQQLAGKLQGIDPLSIQVDEH